MSFNIFIDFFAKLGQSSTVLLLYCNFSISPAINIAYPSNSLHIHYPNFSLNFLRNSIVLSIKTSFCSFSSLSLENPYFKHITITAPTTVPQLSPSNIPAPNPKAILKAVLKAVFSSNPKSFA